MNESEKYVNSLLKRFSDLRWEFFEPRDSDGSTIPQGKKYSDLSFWVSYPDFEGFNNDTLLLLVEVKGYNGFFDNKNYKLGMKYSHYKSYIDVREREGVDVRICFIVGYDGKKYLFWESVDNIPKFKKVVKPRNYVEKDFKTEKLENKRAKFIIWDAKDFRRDYKNLAKI